MTIQTIRPDSTVVNTMALTGAGSAHAALNDNQDSSYVEANYLGFSEVIVGMGTYAIPAGANLKQVRVRLRFATPGFGAITLWYAQLENETGGEIPADGFQNVSAAPVEATGGWKNTAPDGSAWSQSDVDSLRVNVYPGLWTGNVKMVRVYEVYVDLDINYNPTTTITSPTNNGTVTSTTRPSTFFTYADTESDRMEAYRLKIFSSSQYNALGFDPNTSVAAYDSGKIAATSPPFNGVKPNIDLFNTTTYRSYVWVYQQGGPPGTTGFGVSAPAVSTYTINVTPPATPTVTAQWIAGYGGFALITVAAGSGGAATSTVLVERTSNGGTTWEKVPGSPAAPGGFFDTAVVPNRNVNYRARAYTAGGIAGNYSGLSNTIFVVDNEWRIKDPTSSENLILNVIGSSVTHTRPEDKAVFSPLGRTRKVPVSDVIKGNEFTITIEFLTEAQFVAFENLRNKQKTLLLVRGWTGEQWWVTMGADPSMELFNYSPTYRQMTVSFTEVDSPI